MEHNYRIKLILGVLSAIMFIILLCFIYFRRKKAVKDESTELQSVECKGDDERKTEEDLIIFNGFENLTTHDILDAPGEVVGKSSYGTLYKASLQRINSVALLRFLRPACTGTMKEILPVIQMLGSIKHPNLVPLQAFYMGPREEKLLVHSFFGGGTLSQFLRDGNGEYHKWNVIYRISLGITKGLDHLHTGLQKPFIHGNLKSKNILLDENYHPYVSEYGLHLLLNPTAGQEMLESSAAQGYKALDLIKMKDAGKESDVYSLGIIFLELLTRKEPINGNPSPIQDLYLPDSVRKAILDHRISDLFHPNILLRESNDQNPITEERLLVFFQLAMACCSPSPFLRPDIKQILRKLEQIGE